MARASTAAKQGVSRSLLSIGQVLARLNPEFPDLTPSKLRFLEEQQLIRPERTEAGYRKFSPADLDRLCIVLTLQRDQFLPLKVIRGYLDQLDAGQTPVLPGGAPVPSPASILRRDRRLSRAELLTETGASGLLLQDASAAALLAATEPYSEEAVVLLRALVELQRSGIEPRHLRGYRAAADREAGLIESAVQPLLHRADGAGKAPATELSRELETHLHTVRSGLLHAALTKVFS